MKINMIAKSLVVAMVAVIVMVGCATANDHGAAAQLDQIRQVEEVEKANLDNFDDLDFNVFTNQRWNEFNRSHAQDIIVHWPDGRITTGLDVHIEDLKALFVFAPDTRILEHPIRIASEEWTAVTGVFEGTFTEPMPVGGGEMIPPTGKAFKFGMATVGRWENGVMAEEWLF